MDITNRNQYNQAMGQFKLLSSTAGVGSIIPTKWGGFIMPLSTDNWNFIAAVTNELNNAPAPHDISDMQKRLAVELIEDPRFVQFLQQKKGYSQLYCFAAVPHVQLSFSNYIDYKDNPLNEEYKKRNSTTTNAPIERFYVPAINFPKWFYSPRNGRLMPIWKWKDEWVAKGCNRAAKKGSGNLDFFVPPRDPYAKTRRRLYTQEQVVADEKYVYDLLRPVPLVLICANGHISDIPWYNFFCASLKHEKLTADEGFDLFSYKCDDCTEGGAHELHWLTSRNQAESWGVLKCDKCGQTVPLTGIMNIKPLCVGERPWLNKSGSNEQCVIDGQRGIMRVAIVTSNSIYYASTFSSLYIPTEFLTNHVSENVKKAISKLNALYGKKIAKDPQLTKDEFWQRQGFDSEEILIDKADVDWDMTLTSDECPVLKSLFFEDSGSDSVADYRLAEFDLFTDPAAPNRKSNALDFNDVDVPAALQPFITTIKQVNTLTLTTTQLGFGRVKMPMPKIDPVTGAITAPDLQHIFEWSAADVRVLPANQTLGEGIFFALDMAKIEAWVQEHNLNDHYACNIDAGDMGEYLYNEVSQFGRAKFFLLHTFSHLIMKELEFSCGYPTASLSERLYFSDKMCGVLIYTADGAEGSMGGLVWQGKAALIEGIIKSALRRALNCSSDPICWEHEDGLNRAACFGCAMVSETSCEHQNLGLDRRALVDEEFGFFKDLI